MGRDRRKSRHFGIGGLPLVAIVLGAAYLAATYALQAVQWSVMTDELQTLRLAVSVAETGSPVPRIHGEYYGALGQLYPLLISPFFAFLSVPAAVTAAHGLNALLLASAGVPAYLVARDVAGSRAAGWVAAALSAFVPWLVLSTTLLTENAAYPASVWGTWLCYRAVVAPSAGRDLAALAGCALAFFARTQLFVLAVAFPIAALAHELSIPGDPPIARARRALVQHRLLAGAVATAVLAAAAAFAAGSSLDFVLGSYGQAAHGDVFPAGIWRAAAVHLDYVVVGVGIAPFLLATAWAVVALVRPTRPEAHAFALLSVVLVPLLTLEAASFDLRFSPGAFVQDRYLCYLVPLAAVGAAAAPFERQYRGLQAALVLAAALAFLLIAGLASYGGVTLFWASPAAAFQNSLHGAASALGLSLPSFIRGGAAFLGVALAWLIWRAPARLTLALVGVATAAFGASEAAYVADRVALPVVTRSITIEGAKRDWVDAAVPAASSVALLPNPGLAPEYWWDTEFWNRSVDRMLDLGGASRPTPFPVTRMAVDPRTGRIRAADPRALVVIAANETRLGFAGTRVVATANPLTLVRVDRPYRAFWLTRGTSPDGWTLPRKPATIRLYPGTRPGRRRVVLTLSAFSGATRPQSFTVRSGTTVQRGRVSTAGAVQVAFTTCVARGRVAAATLVTDGSVRLPDGRRVSVHLDKVETSTAGRCA
jgi:hypothetical protein